MDFNRYFKTNWSKFLALLFLFAVIAFLGGILFTCGLGFRKRTLFLRMSYMIIAVLWVILSIRAICVKVHFGDIWRGMIDEIYARKDKYAQEMYKKYQDLNSRYPMAVAEYESHCWHQTPRPTNSEIMESALAITEMEWLDREKKARDKVASKHASHGG